MTDPSPSKFQRDWERICTSRSADPPLPIIHVTDAYRITEILRSGLLRPKKCDRLSNYYSREIKATYLFYGRAAYEKSKEGQTTIQSRMPVALVIHADSSLQRQTPLSIYPFDTGAFIDQRYGKFMHDDMALSDFLLGKTLSEAGRFIKMMYDTPEDYVRSREPKKRDVPFSCFHFNSYYQLITEVGDSQEDDRRSALELQSHDDVVLANSRFTLVLPIDYEGDEFILSVAKPNEIRYYTPENQRPKEWYSAMRRVAHEVVLETSRKHK